MYHAKMDDETKERVMNGMSEDGHVKLLFTAIAFGPRIDINDIDIVVVWESRNFLQMFQEVGRCIRGVARSGTAHIFLTGRIIVKSKDPCIFDIVIVPVSAFFVFVATIVKESASAPLLPKY